MSKSKKSDSYEVGYGKPPKSAQFRKGVSGNPKGRPKKGADFHVELIREANSYITINDNGRHTRIPKVLGIAKQLANKALQGEQWAMRLFYVVYPQACERVALLKAQQPRNFADAESVHDLTREQLMWIASQGPAGPPPENNQ